jgi:branched-chain amino acid transport system permease protein
MGLPGIFYVAPVTCVTLVTTLHLFLTRTKFGIAIRATTEDPKLASSLGVNVFHTHLASWFLTGAMAGLAGAALPLWYATSMGGSDELMVNVMAGSILGGLENVYGAILGGVFLAFTQMIMPGMLITTLGLWVSGYVPLIPIIVIVVVLMLMPNGIAGALTSNSRQAQWLRYRISRLLRGINSPQRPV